MSDFSRLLERLPTNPICALVAVPHDRDPTRWRLAWYGLDAVEVVDALEHLAQEVRAQTKSSSTNRTVQ